MQSIVKLVKSMFVIITLLTSTSVITFAAEQDETLEKMKGVCARLERICKENSDIQSVSIRGGDNLKGLRKVDKSAVPFLVNEFSDKKKDRKYRLLILSQLAQTGDDRVLEPARAALNNEDDDIRGISAVLLGRMKDSKAVDGLAENLNHKNKQVRIAAYSALGQIGDKKVLKLMIKKLKEEPEFVARSRFIPALTNFKDESVYNQLIESLRNDSKSDVRASAARALGQYGDTRAHDILLSITENINEDPLVRFYSARSLDKIDPDAYKVMKNIVQEEKNDIVKKELQRIIISKGKGR